MCKLLFIGWSQVGHVDDEDGAHDGASVVQLRHTVDAVIAPLLFIDLLEVLRRHQMQDSMGGTSFLRNIGSEPGSTEKLQLVVDEPCGHAFGGIQVPALDQDRVHHAACSKIPDVLALGQTKLPLSFRVYHLFSRCSGHIDLKCLWFVSTLRLETRSADLPPIKYFLRGFARVKPRHVLLHSHPLLLSLARSSVVNAIGQHRFRHVEQDERHVRSGTQKVADQVTLNHSVDRERHHPAVMAIFRSLELDGVAHKGVEGLPDLPCHGLSFPHLGAPNGDGIRDGLGHGRGTGRDHR
mmetsp:Transcript_90035/g.179060  ORF Transcript_90035/g.179060 Transcript_90035/m.179060 type:complete len:295 (-) Transcript_90035:210-1094(-)